MFGDYAPSASRHKTLVFYEKAVYSCIYEKSRSGQFLQTHRTISHPKKYRNYFGEVHKADIGTFSLTSFPRKSDLAQPYKIDYIGMAIFRYFPENICVFFIDDTSGRAITGPGQVNPRLWCHWWQKCRCSLQTWWSQRNNCVSWLLPAQVLSVLLRPSLSSAVKGTEGEMRKQNRLSRARGTQESKRCNPFSRTVTHMIGFWF